MTETRKKSGKRSLVSRILQQSHTGTNVLLPVQNNMLTVPVYTTLAPLSSAVLTWGGADGRSRIFEIFINFSESVRGFTHYCTP